ncbi:Elongation factor 2 [Sparganum proliferum]
MNFHKNIRNISIIAHADHGKSTLTDSLVSKAGIIVEAGAGDEQEHCTVLNSAVISLYNELAPGQLALVRARQPLAINEEGGEESGFLINLINSPGHDDFSSEATAALQVTDGCLVVVDAVAGVCMQTEVGLREALTERIKPILFLNKLDKAIDAMGQDLEGLYQHLSRVVDSTNVIVSRFNEHDGPMGCVTVNSDVGTVGFGSGLQSWAFTLHTMASFYAKRIGVPADKLASKLWGDNFYSVKEKKWKTQSDDGEVRSFVQLVLDPICKIFRVVQGGNRTEIQKFLNRIDVNISSEESALPSRQMLKCIMHKWLPADNCLLEMICVHLPSPVVSQKYRMELLYEGPHDDEAAVAIRDCDPEGPLMMYVSKMVPTSDEDRFYALGRVFSGKVATGQEVRIMGAGFVYGKDDELYEKSIQRTVLMMGPCTEAVEDVPCGNICGLVGVDQFLGQTGTITTFAGAHNMR